MSAEVISVDPQSPVAGLIVQAAMLFPDPASRRKVLNARAGEMLSRAVAASSTIERAADSLSRQPGGAPYATIVRNEAVAVARALAELAPYDAALAPETEWLPDLRDATAKAKKALGIERGCGGAILSGAVIYAIAQIAEYHSGSVRPSYERAIVAVGERFASLGFPQRASRATVMRELKTWRSVAHMWAAFLAIYFARQAEKGMGAPIPSLSKPTDLQAILQAAGWFRLFVTTTIPSGATTPIVSSDIALEVQTGLPPMKPPLLPVDPVAVGAAARHSNTYRNRRTPPTK